MLNGRTPVALAMLAEPGDSDPDTIRKILDAVAGKGKAAPFPINALLEGVSPNASEPTAYDHDINIGPRSQVRPRRSVRITLAIDWEYASGSGRQETALLVVNLPVGRD
jgi:hypothetical protein